MSWRIQISNSLLSMWAKQKTPKGISETALMEWLNLEKSTMTLMKKVII
jgi:hypothetical protein